MPPSELADKIERVTERAGSGDYIRLDAECWSMVTKALRSSEADQRDAARYRWLRDEIEWLPKFYNGWTGPKKGRFDFLWPSDEENLDAAIDAAMSAPNGDEER